jgi:hypothetical protein
MKQFERPSKKEPIQLKIALIKLIKQESVLSFSWIAGGIEKDSSVERLRCEVSILERRADLRCSAFSSSAGVIVSGKSSIEDVLERGVDR